jgi:hypothetical protein
VRSAWAGAVVGWALGFVVSTMASYRRDDTVDIMATKGLAAAAALALAGAAAGVIFDRRTEHQR